MANHPEGKNVPCPDCDESAIAIVPGNAEIEEEEGKADGFVWTTCRTCGAQFEVFYSTS